MKGYTFSLLLIVMLSTLAGATETLTISKTTQPPKIDGIVDSNDPWSSNWINMTRNQVINSTSAITGKFQLTYDKYNLYLVAVCIGDAAVDTAAANIESPWGYDCSTVYLKMDTTFDDVSMDNPGEYRFSMKRGSVFPHGFEPGRMTCDWQHSNFIIGQTNVGTTYTQEWQMPWAMLTDSVRLRPQWDNKEFQFDIEFIDNTTGTTPGVTQCLLWSTPPEYLMTDPLTMGLIILETKADTRLSQEISFDFILDRQEGEPDFSPVAIATSGLPVYFTSGNNKVATIINNKVHLVSAGQAIIIAHQDGNDIYKAAYPATEYFTVHKRNQLILSKTAKSPQIDGVIDNNDPWAVTWIDLTVNYDGNTTSDITGKFQLTYDENNLYLAVVCTGDKQTDTSSSEIPNSWENDCIEVFVLLDTSSEKYFIDKPGDYQFRMRRASVFPDRFDPGPMWCDWRHSDFKIGQMDLGTSYTQEWQMPWAILADSAGMSPAWNGTKFRFDVHISDNTTGAAGGRTQQLFWCQQKETSWHTYQYFGWIKLLSTVAKTTKWNEISFSPNPADSKLQINGEITEQAIISIFNVEGKQVLYTKIPKDKAIDIGYLSAGVYLVKIFDGKEIFSGKFIKR